MCMNLEQLSIEEKRAKIKADRLGNYRGDQNGNYWSPEDDEKLTRLYYEWYDYAEMAIAMRRSESAIINRCEKLKLREVVDEILRQVKE